MGKLVLYIIGFSDGDNKGLHLICNVSLSKAITERTFTNANFLHLQFEEELILLVKLAKTGPSHTLSMLSI